MLSAVHVMGMKTARQHLRNPPRIEKTSFLGLERNRVRRFLLSPTAAHHELISFRILMQCRAPLVGAPNRTEIGIFHSQLRYVPTSRPSWNPHHKLVISQHSLYTPSYSGFLLIILIHPQITIAFLTFSIDQREEQGWRTPVVIFIPFRSVGASMQIQSLCSSM